MFNKKPSENLQNLITWLWQKNLIIAKNQEQGNVLLIALGIGLVLIVGTSVILFSSSKNKANEIANESTKQSLGLTEAGIDKMQTELSKANNRFLLEKNNTEWNQYSDPTNSAYNTTTVVNHINNTSVYNVCDSNNNGQITDEKRPTLKTPFQVNLGNGNYQLVSYSYTPVTTNTGEARLQMQGTKSATTNSSQSKIEVKLNIKKQLPGGGGAPALLAEDISIGKIDAYANTMICTIPNNCPLSCTAGATSPTQTQLQTALNVNTNGGNTFGVTTNSSGQPAISGTSQILVGPTNIPPIPKAPTGVTIHSLNSSGETGGRVDGNLVINPSSFTYQYDSAKNKKIWYFQINDWNKGEIWINTHGLKTGTDPDEVRVYWSQSHTGSQSLGGSSALVTFSNSSNPTNPPNQLSNAILPQDGQIRLYGGYASSTQTDPNPQNWNIGGTVCITAFVHAPNTNIGVSQGTGCSFINIGGASNSDHPNIYGAIWAKTLGTVGNNDNSGIFVEDLSLTRALVNNGETGSMGINQISSVTGWDRKSF
jgi:hypothetical protein